MQIFAQLNASVHMLVLAGLRSSYLNTTEIDLPRELAGLLL